MNIKSFAICILIVSFLHPTNAQNIERSTSIQGHSKEVKKIRFSKDGKLLLSSGDDNEVKLWSFPDFTNKYTFKNHSKAVNSIAFNADDSRIVSGSDDETGNVWNAATGELVFNFGKTPYTGGGIQIGSDDNFIYDVAFSKDGQKILAAGGNVLARRHQVRIYNSSKGEFLKALNLASNIILSIDVHPDGKSFLSSSASMDGDGTVQLNNIETGEVIKVYDSHLGDVRSVVFSNDGKHLAATSDRSVIVWEVSSGKKVATLNGHHDIISSLSFSSDGKHLVSASYDQKVIIWNFLEGEDVATIDNQSKATAVAFSPDGKFIVSGGSDGKINTWDFVKVIQSQAKKENTTAGENEILPRVRKEFVSPFANLKEAPELVIENGTHNDFVQSIKYTPDGKEIVTASWDKTIRIWDAANGNLIRTIHVPSYAGIEGQIYTMDLSPDKKFIAVAGSSVGQKYDKKSANYIGDYVLLIDFKTGKILDATTDHEQSIFSVAFSPDGKKLASCAGQLDNKVNVYSLDALKGKLTLTDSFVMTVIAQEFFPGCQSVFGDMCEHTVLGVRFSADSKEVFAVDAHGMLIRYTLKTATSEGSYKLIGESPGRKSAAITGKLSSKAVFRSMAMDPKGRYVAAGDGNGKVLIFNSKGAEGAEKGSSSEILLATIALQNNEVVAGLNFDPTGSLLGIVTGGEVRIYEILLDGVTTPKMINQPLVVFKEHVKNVLSVAFSPDGKSVISSGGDTNASYVWEARTGKVKFKLGGNRYGTSVTRVGTHNTNPFIIGYGTEMIDRNRYNQFGTINKAFDLKNLRVIDHADEADFNTAESDNIKEGVTAPDFKTLFNEQMISYLQVKKGEVIISTRSALFLNDATNLLAMTGTQSYGLAKSRDEETFFAGQSDGQIKIYDTKTMKVIATLYVAANNEWILFTPDGYYTASRHGSKLVGWLINEGVRTSPRFYPFEQFDLRLNRPDIVLSRIGGLPKKRIDLLYKAYQKRLEKMGISEKSLTDNLNAPTIEVDVPITESTQKLLNFKVKASDTQNDLDRLNVYVNDVPLYGSKGQSLKATPSKTLDRQVVVELTNGQNKIQVSVLNTAGVESFQETRYVNYRGPAVTPNLYVLAIGVSDYTDNNFDLKYASKDANDIADLYAKQVGKFGAVKTMTILDAEATKEKIKAAKIFLKQARPDDEVILFAAGHGLLDDQLDFYFGTSDVDFNNPAVRGLKYDDLEGLLDEVASRKKLMLIDACHSGELDKEAVTVSNTPVAANESNSVKSRGFKNLTNNELGTNNVFELMRMMFSDLRRGSGAMVISSASGVEFAFENDTWKNGVFTYSLLEGLKTGNANLNKDTQVQVSELRDYVIKRVGELTNGKQTPTSRKENLEFDFKVW